MDNRTDEVIYYLKHLSSALDHCLRFSTLKRNWPDQYSSFVDLLGEARGFIVDYEQDIHSASH